MSQTIQALLRHLRGTDPDGDPTDADLLEQFAARRDGAAFAALVARHGPMVLGVCRRLLGDAHDAEDAFQATFLILARRAGELRPADPVGAWLHGVACRTAAHARCDRARRKARERRASAMPAADPTPAVLWEDLRPLLDEEVGRLPAEYRVPVVLCYLGGKTYAEAAREIGCPKGTIATRLAKAREVLRDRLSGRGLTLPAAGLAAALAGDARAALPAPLFQATVEAATTSVVTPAVAALTAEVLKAMTAPRLTAITALLAAVVLAGAGTAALAYRSADADPAGDAPRPAKADERPKSVEGVRADPPAAAPVVAAGEWSESANGLRGRLVVADGKARAIAVYVELESVGTAGADRDVYFDPEGLRCVLSRADGRPAPEHPFGTKRGPPAGWVTLPYDAAAKLRANPAGYDLPDGRFLVLPTARWLIKADDPGEYRLSGTLTVAPPAGHGRAGAWAGKLDLPPVGVRAFPPARPSVADAATGVTVAVAADGRTVVARRRDGAVAWEADVIATARIPFDGPPAVRALQLTNGKVTAVFGRHSFADFDLTTGRFLGAGSD